MNNLLEFEQLIEHYDQHFSGWDFAWISDTDRISSEPLNWSYTSLLLKHLPVSNCMLDMGTGGGEMLSMLRPLPAHTYATEAYAPNVILARQRLEPLGVQVETFQYDHELPFADHQFDLVINRHESYDPAELRRIMQSGSLFVTQQVGGQDCLDINTALDAPANSAFQYWNLDYAIKQLKEHDFRILRTEEQFPIQRFYDIGAVVYYLKAVEWQIDGFKPAFYMDRLYSIHLHMQSHGYWDVRQHRFLLMATT
ncbi:class I SAM-dependent methyltransferase [Paenibacillus sp. WLX2291]|uniref:class I SAM-dependent methyltransferase n=1 Tax=Paenibacillus sp. WLX2291 TaxID=3296934 RepID=UPI00398430DD